MEFRLTAIRNTHPNYLEIRAEYKWWDEKTWSSFIEVVPRERFLNDKEFAEYTIDSIMDKIRQNIKVEKLYGK